MAEYVEREKVLSKAAPVEGCFSDMISAYDVLMLPAADVAPVRNGRWIKCEDGTCYCSECNQNPQEWYERAIKALNYCPNCGAKMDGGTN